MKYVINLYSLSKYIWFPIMTILIFGVVNSIAFLHYKTMTLTGTILILEDTLFSYFNSDHIIETKHLSLYDYLRLKFLKILFFIFLCSISILGSVLIDLIINQGILENINKIVNKDKEEEGNEESSDEENDNEVIADDEREDIQHREENR